MHKITLKTLHEATLQQIFDQVAAHLLTQNERSGRRDGEGSFQCYYRGERGLKCAAGCLIADDEYRPEMERNSWYGLRRLGLIPPHYDNEIQALQGIHDGQPKETWLFHLKEFAIEHGLSTDVLEQFT